MKATMVGGWLLWAMVVALGAAMFGVQAMSWVGGTLSQFDKVLVQR